MRTNSLGLSAMVLAFGVSAPATYGGGALIANLPAVLDNTLIEEGTGGLSNALGPNIFAGQTRFSGIRRGLVKFDLSSIPSNATIVSASLRLELTKAVSDGNAQSIHRVLASWGEGTSSTGDDSLNPGGGGDFSTPGDATWVHRFFSGTNWASAGGDFAATASATTIVDSIEGPYVWSGSGLTADVQAWHANPSSNHGWVIRGVEGGMGNAKRYASKDHPNAALRPELTVAYTVPPPCTGDLNGDGQRNTVDLTLFLGSFGATVPPGTGGDLDGSGTVTTADLVIFLGAFGQPC